MAGWEACRTVVAAGLLEAVAAVEHYSKIHSSLAQAAAAAAEHYNTTRLSWEQAVAAVAEHYNRTHSSSVRALEVEPLPTDRHN